MTNKPSVDIEEVLNAKDWEDNAKIARAAERTLEIIYREVAIGSGFRLSLLNELYDVIAETGRKPVRYRQIKPEGDEHHGCRYQRA